MMVPELRGLRQWGMEIFGEYGYLGGATAARWFLDPIELGPNDILLDVGCASGATLRLAVRRYRCTGVGFDPDAEHTPETERRTEEDRLREKMRFIAGTASQTGLAASSVNAVVAFEAPYDAAEAWRVLRAGGRLCLAAAHDGELSHFEQGLEAAGFRTEQLFDATSEVLAALEGARERFADEPDRPPALSHSIAQALAWYQEGPERRYLRWAGRRR